MNDDFENSSAAELDANTAAWTVVSPAPEDAPKPARARRRKPPLSSKQRRDLTVKYHIGRLYALYPHLRERPGLAPQIKSYIRLTLMIERGYERIRDGGILAPSGEIRPSVDTLRRLMMTQSYLARELGLTLATSEQFAKAKPVLDLETFREEFKRATE
jgi:hypothetical protein